MPITCIVAKCGRRGDRDNVTFFSVPTATTHRFMLEKNELSKKRRALWIAAIKRDDLTESKIKYQRVCGKHFITGQPAPLADETHPDWVPSQNMGHVSQSFSKRKEDLERKERIDKRRKLQLTQDDNASVSVDEYDNLSDDEGSERDTGMHVQTDITLEQLRLQSEQLSFALKKISQLEQKIETTPLGLIDDTTNKEKWKYYTGFSYEVVNLVIYPLIKDHISSTSTTALSSFNQLLLTLVKLRLDLHFKDLAYRFQISASTASAYFGKTIDILYKRLKPFIVWPDASVSQKNIPTCFKEAFHDKTTTIIDCFEVFIEKPADYLTQQQCWSNYKHHNTVKFLIGITPQGSVCYISEAWGGRASDKQIVEFSAFCSNIKPGDIVLADRGFLIKETLGVLQAKLVIPVFTKGKDQLHPLEIEETRQIAQVRIHVERIIGLIKNKFRIFTGVIPISMINKDNNPTKLNILDKIVTVCCALANISPSIVPL